MRGPLGGGKQIRCTIEASGEGISKDMGNLAFITC